MILQAVIGNRRHPEYGVMTAQFPIPNNELNYLAKRLVSFDTYEAAQFSSIAEARNYTSMKDLINLTFCCQQVTVITDFSDLNAVGRDHYRPCTAQLPPRN